MDEEEPTLDNLKDMLEQALESGTLDKICSSIKSYQESNPSWGKGEIEKFIKSLPHQVIFYGAPGTGKSFIVETLTKPFGQAQIQRTTFHPESDYSSFAGCYKPISKRNPNSGVTQIEYEFTPQSFISSYVAAKKDPKNLYFLIVEEINRGNCAAIFGDLFQLLDRDDNGKSRYPINCDTDIKEFLEKEKINNPNIICLPENLYIWATMNTSDQCLYPMDSAFKRRWDMEYVQITDAGEGWVIEVADNTYISWWDFLSWINDVIVTTTESQDKQLGYFFIKPSNGKVISRRQFINKVIFYLWNDVFRDYMKSQTPFDLVANRKENQDNQEKKQTGEIKSFDEFFKGNTLDKFVWHLPYVPMPTNNLVNNSNSGAGNFPSNNKEAVATIDWANIPTCGRIKELPGPIPSSVPSGYKIILHRANSQNSYVVCKSDKDILLGMYFLDGYGQNAQTTADNWRNALATIIKAPNNWISTNKNDFGRKRYLNIQKIGNKNEELFIFNDTSRNHISWDVVTKLAQALGTIVKDK